MTYLYQSNTFGDPRLAFIIAGRANVTHFSMKLDHRIPWNVLKNVLNRVLAKEVDSKVVNALMRLSPSADHSTLLTAFTIAVKESKSGRLPPPHQLEALQSVEQEIFSLPINLALGTNERADDPGGDNLDFTPDDVDHAGNCRATQAGRLHALRETLFGQLSQSIIDAKAINLTVSSMIREAGGRPALSSGTAANFDNWHPGPIVPGAPPVARTNPPYRYWMKPSGTPMTSVEILTMLQLVTKRAKKSGKKQ